mmetsp:Transcript_22983/g.33927  ORF Transcript_22983/g.33927 Transcript_22983/m.33927 type:complete len:296 (+) Transcript_22983:42-929(+)
MLINMSSNPKLGNASRVGRQSFVANDGREITGGGSTVARSMQFRRSLPLIEVSAEDLEREPTQEEYELALSADDLNKSKMDLLSEIHGGKLTEQGVATAEKYKIYIPEDLVEAWKELRDAKDPTFVEIGIESLVLSCSLNEFNEMFLSDEADKSFAHFLEDTGELEVGTTPWKLSEDDEFSLTRKISYLHPVNVPMAPPQARALKEQCYRRFDDHGICVDTQTVVQDVPKADCFYVDDRLIVEPVEEGGVRLTWRFEMRFTSWTMFRRIIETTTRKETKSFMDKYKSMLERSTGI